MMIRKSLALFIFILIAQFGFAARPIIVFMTDFGTVDDSVAICKGVMLQITPEAEIIDITHEVTPYSIEDAADFLPVRPLTILRDCFCIGNRSRGWKHTKGDYRQIQKRTLFCFA